MSWGGSLPRLGTYWDTAMLMLQQHARSPPPIQLKHRPRFFFPGCQFLRRRPPQSRYVLSRSFASGLFMFGVPNRASETKAVVSSCATSCPCSAGPVDAATRGTFLAERKKHRRSLLLAASLARLQGGTRCFHDGGRGGGGGVSRDPSSGKKDNGKRNVSYRSDKDGKGYRPDKETKTHRFDKDSKGYRSEKDNYKSSNGSNGNNGNNGQGFKSNKKDYYEKKDYHDKKDYYHDKAAGGTLAKDVKGSNGIGSSKFSKGKYSKPAAAAASSSSYPSTSSSPQSQPSTLPSSQPPSSPSSQLPDADKGASGQSVMNRIQNLHLASKEELLAAASGMWERLKIRFKWLTIRQVRPFTLDEISAFFSLLLVGHIMWIVLGTTMFFSLLIWLVNTVLAQEYLAGVIGNYLTKETGVRVVFESAIVPRWKDGCISFKNVYVSRRPGALKGKNVQKGSRALVLAAAALAPGNDDELDKLPVVHASEDEENQNYTQFDLTLDTVNVTLSLAKWMNGRGLLSNCEIKGVRGVVDRTHVHWDPDMDPRSLRHEHVPGDFEIDNFKLEDLLVTVYQPGGFRPFSVSVYSCELPQLRKQWLFYDFLSASHVSGSFDDSLFTIHPRQTHGATFRQMNDFDSDNGGVYPWKKTSRLRIDGLNIDHLNTGVQGPFGWIQTGNVDIVADVMFPVDSDEGIGKIFQDLMDKMERAVADRKQKFKRMVTSELDSVDEFTTYYQNENGKEPTEEGTPENSVAISSEGPVTVHHAMDKRYLIFDLRLQLNDPYAAVPLFTSDLSYVNNALVRPIVAYINSTKTWIPVNCRVVKSLNEFDGSWTMYDSGLMDDLSAETYEAFARDVADANIKKRRMRAVGLWSLQVFMNAFMAAFASAMIL